MTDEDFEFGKPEQVGISCWWCESNMLVFPMMDAKLFSVTCPTCGVSGPILQNRDSAVEAMEKFYELVGLDGE